MARLPSEIGTRFGVVATPDDERLTQALATIAAQGALVQPKSEEVKNNLYEFDQKTAVSPLQAVWYRIRRMHHCSAGKKYLGSRDVVLELLERQGDNVVIPRPGLGPRVYGPLEFDKLTRPRVPSPVTTDWPFPIDIVYTWVDSDDPVWQQQRAQLSGDELPESPPASATNAARWHSRDELKYSLRSAWMYAPWIRKIFIVTNGQVPTWLDRAARNVTVVAHSELYPDASDLPTFNSNHIESVLHRIPGLSEHFLYLNDDFFFAAPAKPSDYFIDSGLCRIFRSPRYLDERPVTPNDRATVAAHKNTRDAIEAHLGERPTRKFKHVPYVMRRSIWEEIDQEFGEELAATRRNRFRSFSDLNGQFLYCHYAMLRGAAIASAIQYLYVEVAEPDLADKLHELDDPRLKVFCLNDSNSTEETVDANSDLIRDFLERRFPIAAPWERGSAAYDTPTSGGIVDVERSGSLEAEVRVMGPTFAKFKYRELMLSSRSQAVARKLLRLALNQRDADTALEAVRFVWTDDPKRALAKLNILSKCGSHTDELQDLIHLDTLPHFTKALGYIGRTVEGPADLAIIRAIVEAAPSSWQVNAETLAKLGGAARRAGDLDEARRYLELAVQTAHAGQLQGTSHKREDDRLSDPWVVVDDLLEIASASGAAVFADAGTLLGFVREGDFLGHDYDIDFSCRDTHSFDSLAMALKTDWRFDVSRGRAPDRVIQARHVNGTLIDIFRHVSTAGGWVKESHVYGWRFSEFDLEYTEVNSRKLLVPSPSEQYLEQMYGTEWRVPIPGFDSRLYAPNCYFPDRGEIICTILNKVAAAVMRRDVDEAKEGLDFVRDRFDYSPPVPINEIIR